MAYDLIALCVLEVYIVVDNDDLRIGCEGPEMPTYVNTRLHRHKNMNTCKRL